MRRVSDRSTPAQTHQRLTSPPRRFLVIGYPLANQTVQTFLQANQGFNVTDETLALFPNPNSSNTTLNTFNVSAQVSHTRCHFSSLCALWLTQNGCFGLGVDLRG